MKKFTDFYLKEELQKRGLNPNNPEFLDDPRYNEIKNMKIISGKLGAITYDYYIRSNWFKDGITKLKQGRFDIGAKRDEAPINMAKLIDEICQEAIDNGEEDEAAYSTENIRRKLIGSPSGIRHNLKTKIAFDLNDYHNQEFEKLKLLKVLYSIEKRQKGKINITSLLSYLSLENVDKRIIGDQSVHGEIITELLSEIRLELDESFHKTVLDAIVKIVMMWNKKLLEVAKISKMPHHKDVRIYELIRIKQYLINLKNRLPEPQIVSESNIMEAFYLRVMQLQELCRTEDVNRITDFILNSTHTKEMLGKKQRLNPEFMNQVITDLESFIQQQAQKVTEAVYQKDNVTDSEISNIVKWSTHVPTLLNSYNKQVYAEERQNLTCFFLVSCMQEIMLSETLKKGDDEYEFKNNHYGSDRKGRGLHSNLKKMNKNILVEEALELIWVGKVERRMYANQDLLEEYLLIQEIGRLANEFIGIIAKLPDLETMFYWNDFLLSQIIVAEKAPILHYTAFFNSIIREKTGYSCESHSARMFQYFDNINIANNITNIFLNEVAKDIQLSKSGYTRDKQIMNMKIEDEAFIVVYAFDRNPRRLIIHNFMPIMADDAIELGNKAGLEKFKKHDEFIDLMKRI
ncbi:hypothetical protein ABH966_005399 [Lysinibacillus sp. RC46]|uniref:hypothetical protein n=1 Tax=Lysinibacillus sp. RC46 TaxID=3156295 RepID=UPI003514FC7F